ncbi:LacI family DNA-binding transcriptional regulator [Micromonospora sp. NPDC000089]|uniref:LacI family DNA-binding transcriptional regulator n=1 Tax=unclassified Micromonospora TaxID=2617518 RepID=UPI003698FBE7
MATLKDVAALAGVSVKTVSNVVNGYPFVSDGVRQRVQHAVEALHYRPNRSARELRAGRDGVLTLALPAPGHPYGDDLADAFRRAARERGQRLVVERVDGDDHGRAVGRPGQPATGQTALLSADAGQVMLGGSPDGRRDRVAVDLVRAAFDATEHLLRGGRERIFLIDVEAPSPSPPPHLTGCRQALDQWATDTDARRAHERSDQPEHARADRHGRAEGYRAARALLTRHQGTDALLCSSDLLAVGAVRAAFDAGLRVPEDVAVVGFGDLEEGRWSRPTLSTVAVDRAGVARAAIALLIDRLARPDAPPVEIVAPHAVLPRESSAGPPRQRSGAPGQAARTGRRMASRSDMSSPSARSAASTATMGGG